MRTARGIAAATALWAGALALTLPSAARAQDALAVARVCAYGTLGGAAVVGGNAPIRCEPPAASTDATRPPSLRSVPASNPVGVVPQAVAPAPGFEPVWEDGRVNPGRGVPRPVSGPAVLGVGVARSAS